MNAATEVLRLAGVRVVAGRREILNVDHFEVGSGELVALLGPNGSGKSTLLRTAALLVRPTEGEVRLFGLDTRGRRRQTQLRRRTASVFTDPTLLDMPARANVEVALSIQGIARGERRRRAEVWLDRLGVLHLASARPHTLSAGEAQRVALARAFAVGPELLFLDEPFASLDFETRARLVGDLRELLASEDTAAIIATHDRSEAELLARRVAVLLDGRVAQHGLLADVFEHSASPAVARFLGHSVVEREHLVRLFPHLAPQSSVAGIPSAAIELVTRDTADSVEARVLAVRGVGGRIHLVCDLRDLGAPVVVELGARGGATQGVRKGDLVYVRVDLEQLYWF